MKILTKRFRSVEKTMPHHDAVLQIGVGAIPMHEIPLIAHIEISVLTAIKSEIFARSYGFEGHNKRLIKQAALGERYFMDRCNMVWTNSTWTAQGLMDQGLGSRKIWIHPPAAGAKDPGPIERDWNRCNILFVGVNWKLKGGDLLVEAFKLLKNENAKAALSIVGCDPQINYDGVTVYGHLYKNRQKDQKLLEELFQKATIFCMPSYWESTGLVYFEAALWGLPLIMLKGQGREEIFPTSMALHLEKADPKSLADALIELYNSPKTMERMGNEGRKTVLQKYTWEKVATGLYHEIAKRI